MEIDDVELLKASTVTTRDVENDDNSLRKGSLFQKTVITFQMQKRGRRQPDTLNLTAPALGSASRMHGDAWRVCSFE